MDVSYAPTFIRQFKSLEKNLQEEVIEKIELFRDRRNHRSLKVHRLTGRLAGRFSFSVNYKFRIVFFYLPSRSVVLLAVGDHDIYSV